MPGFNIGGMGSRTGDHPVGRGEVKRTYRWIFQLTERGGAAPARGTFVYLQSCSRPTMTLESHEQWHNQERVTHQGQTSWNDIELTFYEQEQPIDLSREVWEWITTQVNDVPNANAYSPADYKKNSKIKMLSAGGDIIESWMLYNSWPSEVNWEDLNYEGGNLAHITTTMKMDRAVKEL